jgi:hypothetical protein
VHSFCLVEVHWHCIIIVDIFYLWEKKNIFLLSGRLRNSQAGGRHWAGSGPVQLKGRRNLLITTISVKENKRNLEMRCRETASVNCERAEAPLSEPSRVNGQKSNGSRQRREPRRKAWRAETSKQIGARNRAEREEPAASSRRRAVGPRFLLEIAAASARRVGAAGGLEGRRDDGSGRSKGDGRAGAAVGRAGDAGAHRGARGDRAGGRRRAPQRQDDVGGGGQAAPGAWVPPHSRSVQVEEPRQPLQGTPATSSPTNIVAY